MSRSGYYRYLLAKPSAKAQLEEKLVVKIKAISQEARNSAGKRTLCQHLRAKGYAIGVYATRTLMKKAGIACKQGRRYRVTTRSQHTHPIADNRLDRQFTVSESNKVWVGDITYLWTQEGWLYVAVVLD